jgi:16S rRNA processing protein RimM
VLQCSEPGKVNKPNKIKQPVMVPSAENRFIEIGRIGRPRGLEGIVRFMPNQYFTDGLFDRVDLFYMKNNRSDLVPTRIEDMYVETKRNQQSFFVKFDMITTRDDAESAKNRALFMERDFLEKPPSASGEEPSLFGYTVWFDGKEFGEVLDVLENPAHPILEVKHGISTILIPLADQFVDETDHEKKVVFCRNLDQLTEE